MKIIHYFLGFPPYRTGGLTKYAIDLMTAQLKDGHVIIALWPGEIKKTGGKPLIKKRNKEYGIQSFELINPLPVPLDEGIKNCKSFMASCKKDVYLDFLKKEKPSVIHFHTIMGIHREFIDAANLLKIRTVFTSHDYFGLCPKVTLYRYGYCCDDDNECKNCIQCNTKALSLKKIQLMQTPLYRKIKNVTFVKVLRMRHRKNFFSEEILPEMPAADIEEKAALYRKLRKYYVEMYESIDFIHFNSSIAKKIYERYINPKDCSVISITHQDIKADRNIEHIKSKILRILYLAPAKPSKGFDVLKKALDQLWDEGKKDVELYIFSPVKERSPYMVVNENGYKYEELENIMRNADVLVAPSIWYETFGFTVLEAVSYGVPVIVSDHVGAKDIIGNSGIIIRSGSSLDLINALNNIQKIHVNKDVRSWEEFLEINYSIYRGETLC